ncbi:hypothetical protein H6F95_07875 [Cyanobacteria bacterium FACHB-471]|nr:hypothetical protein [Cyanobacteria bacterium FACHB-471]
MITYSSRHNDSKVMGSGASVQAPLVDELNAEGIRALKYYKLDSDTLQHPAYLDHTTARMLHLEPHHMISQEYVLPIPYVCQIYHLLNLKHLESVHGFSLNGLQIIEVSEFAETTIGGSIKFQTTLNSPLSLLRIWRPPVVEVELILHTPYTVELNVPVYNGKKIRVMFNILPLSHNEHKLFIDIYSDLAFPKPLLQILLHFASSLTLFEDLPYLRKLAEGRVCHSIKPNKLHSKPMWLFRRFVELYGSSLEQPQLQGAIELQPKFVAIEAMG